jgi:hypothetical protein
LKVFLSDALDAVAYPPDRNGVSWLWRWHENLYQNLFVATKHARAINLIDSKHVNPCKNSDG